VKWWEECCDDSQLVDDGCGKQRGGANNVDASLLLTPGPPSRTVKLVLCSHLCSHLSHGSGCAHVA
jgi:hypothetical protein